MPVLLFGSIGTLMETSEIQRQAFNQAFANHGLDWNWERDAYVYMLEVSGGAKRVQSYAASPEQAVAIENNRDGVRSAKAAGIKTGVAFPGAYDDPSHLEEADVMVTGSIFDQISGMPIFTDHAK